ncbi:hypothetical protein [Salinicola aestuarinus]|uniref:hypothetical protein n=1 Tax=Salinicola aestuarinus TaxID=1949082 RepID=UPI001300BCB1|nr:hypothetical protein [Salinicola aestuarinus]
MKAHQASSNSEYHFESSDEYCDPILVRKVKDEMVAESFLSELELAQLIAIVKLETARYEYAVGDSSLKAHGETVQAIRNELIQANGVEPFDNGKVESEFYRRLNREYGNE